MEDFVRRHGFQRPFHPLQVLSWVVFGTDVAVFSFFCLPLIGAVGAQVAVSVCFAISVVVLVVATYRATRCDPADLRVLGRVDAELGNDAESMSFCTMCAVQVHPRSKHCRACNKCVGIFDHHCMWLNNCVGERNYRDFFVAVSAVSVMIGIVLGSCVYLLVDYVANEQQFDERVRGIALFASTPREFFLGLLIGMCFVNTPLLLLDFQLVLLHVFLMSQNLTTYEYIMNKRMMEESRLDGRDGNTLAKGSAAVANTIRGGIKTLPGCMDWIVFARCGQRRKRTRAGVEWLGVPVQGSVQGVPASSSDGERAQASDSKTDRSPARSSGERSPAAAGVELTPSPPGSTTAVVEVDRDASPSRADEASVATARELPFSFEPEGGIGRMSPERNEHGEELAASAAASATEPAAQEVREMIVEECVQPDPESPSAVSCGCGGAPGHAGSKPNEL